jgi:hypothetical protein
MRGKSQAYEPKFPVIRNPIGLANVEMEGQLPPDMHAG